MLCFLKNTAEMDPKSQNDEQRGPIEEELLEDEEEEEEERNANHHRRRLCDFCGISTAVLYCRADSAKLCFNCDHEVHSTNVLFNKHTRSQLCDSCDANPSSIHCFTDNAVLCQNCDWVSHGRGCSSSVQHDRRPIEGFTGCPSAIELSLFLGFEDLGKKSFVGGGDDGFSDLLVWETPPIVSIDDLIVSSSSGYSAQNLQTVGIPPLPKNRNTYCGKYKEEMVHQLRDMLKAENSLNNGFEDVEALLGFQPFVSMPTFEPGCADFDYFEGSSIQLKGKRSDAVDETQSRGHHEERLVPPEKLNDAGESGMHPHAHHEEESKCPIRKESLPAVLKATPRYLSYHSRDLSISRYKEKKKTRRYEKHIRYESRKARAECRTRIRGRFAKVE